VCAAIVTLAGRASAVLTRDDFTVKTTSDLVDLCSAPESDPMYLAAIGFCHGYVVGAWHFHQALAAGPHEKPLACPPDPPPSRTEAIKLYVGWAQQHPEYANELPVETMFKFFIEKWPCPHKGGKP